MKSLEVSETLEVIKMGWEGWREAAARALRLMGLAAAAEPPWAPPQGSAPSFLSRVAKR